MKKIVVVLVFMLLLSNFIFAYTDYGGGVCGCNSCTDCNNALNDNTICYNEVRLEADINNYVGTCIDSPHNFNNKIFDCQGHTIDGDGSGTDYGIHISSRENNTIQNCIVQNFTRGFHLYLTLNNSFMNNVVIYNNRGFNLYSASNNSFFNNTANNNTEYGFNLVSSSNSNSLTNNIANYNSGGIHLYLSYNNTLTNNTANYNDNNGFHLSSASDNTLINNKADHNSDNGFYIYSSDNNILLNNQGLLDRYGIYLFLSLSNNIKNNTVSANSVHGIYLSHSNYTNLTSNTAINNQIGIYLSYSSNNILVNNSEQSAGAPTHGIFLSNSHNNTLTGNSVKSNSESGIYLSNSNDNNLTDNTARSSYSGILLTSSNNNILSNNNAHHNNDGGVGIGIVLHSSSNNVLFNNTASFNGDFGIHLVNSNNNTIIGSNIYHQGGDGIRASNSNNNLIDSSIINSNNFVGIRLSGSNNILNNNTLYLSSSGIVLDGGDNNTIANENISHHDSYGILLEANYNILINNTIYNNGAYQLILNGTNPVGNLIYNNIFNATGTQGVVADSGSNYWNTSYDCSQTSIVGGCMGGNWYSNYSGTDDGSGSTYPHNTIGDGIGDNPPNYSIYDYSGGGASNIDYLPLTNVNKSHLNLTPPYTNATGTVGNIVEIQLKLHNPNFYNITNISCYKQEGVSFIENITPQNISILEPDEIVNITVSLREWYVANFLGNIYCEGEETYQSTAQIEYTIQSSGGGGGEPPQEEQQTEEEEQNVPPTEQIDFEEEGEKASQILNTIIEDTITTLIEPPHIPAVFVLINGIMQNWDEILKILVFGIPLYILLILITLLKWIYDVLRKKAPTTSGALVLLISLFLFIIYPFRIIFWFKTISGVG